MEATLKYSLGIIYLVFKRKSVLQRLSLATAQFPVCTHIKAGFRGERDGRSWVFLTFIASGIRICHNVPEGQGLS